MIPATIPGLLVITSQHLLLAPETCARRLSENAFSISSNSVKHPMINYGNSQNNNLIFLTNSRRIN